MLITPQSVRYIKLGEGGRWADASLDQNEIHFGFPSIPHDLAVTKDRVAIAAWQVGIGRPQNVASQDAREIVDFYSLDQDCLWITFARQHLWWTFSYPVVEWGGSDGILKGVRYRKCIAPWRNTDLQGAPLKLLTLSTSLTQLAAFRRTICKVSAQDYLLRRINGVSHPIIDEAQRAQASVGDAVNRAIRMLHQDDFETLADIILARSGWHRASAIGGAQEFIDIAMEQPATGELAAVQVKARADQVVLDDYIGKFEAAGSFSRLFFICHTATPRLRSDRKNVHIWQGDELAKLVQRVGLVDWVLEKI